MKLSQKKCLPCEGGTPQLTESQVQDLLKQTPSWNLNRGHLKRIFKFKDFRQAMNFLNQVAEVAEAENHHPDFCVHYNKVEVEIWTHAIDGLSENDFILAAKLEEIGSE